MEPTNPQANRRYLCVRFGPGVCDIGCVLDWTDADGAPIEKPAEGTRGRLEYVQHSASNGRWVFRVDRNWTATKSACIVEAPRPGDPSTLLKVRYGGREDEVLFVDCWCDATMHEFRMPAPGTRGRLERIVGRNGAFWVFFPEAR